jgi:hypothetical protein
MSREDPQLKLRLPEEIKNRLTEAARDNKRSVNAEILARLEASLSEPQISPFVPGTYLREIRKLLNELQQAIGSIEDENFDMRGNKHRREMIDKTGHAMLAEARGKPKK